jgi:HAE1 family hydrophobic/amphiphilic exporter-1
MSPALCALILRPPQKGKRQNFFLRGFNRVYGASENGYARIVGGMVRRTAIMGLVYIGMIVLSGWSLMSIPTGFLPIEDQGYAIAAYQLPDAASQERAREVSKKMNAIISKTPGSSQRRPGFRIGSPSAVSPPWMKPMHPMPVRFSSFSRIAPNG